MSDESRASFYPVVALPSVLPWLHWPTFHGQTGCGLEIPILERGTLLHYHPVTRSLAQFGSWPGRCGELQKVDSGTVLRSIRSSLLPYFAGLGSCYRVFYDYGSRAHTLRDKKVFKVRVTGASLVSIISSRNRESISEILSGQTEIFRLKIHKN